MEDGSFDLNEKDKTGSTVLHRAAGAGLADLCWKLVQDGSFTCVDAANWQSLTAEHIAAGRGHAEIAWMLHQSYELLCDPRLSVHEVRDAMRLAIKKSGRSRLMEFASINEEDAGVVAARSKHSLSLFGPLAESCMLLIDDYKLNMSGE